MRVGILTTSWPSADRPWAGSFVAELTDRLAEHGHDVDVIAPAWRGFGHLRRPAEGGLHPASLPGAPGPLRDRPVRAAAALARLHQRARGVRADVWLAHWAPTALAAPRGAPCVTALHGSDLDGLEALPRSSGRAVASALASRGPVAAVAPWLAARWAALGGGDVRVVRLGAPAPEPGSLPAPLAWWASSPRPRVLTVAREARGKGLEVARAAAAEAPELAWAFVTPRLGVAPPGVRAALRAAHLLVVPTRDGPDLPGEGAPRVHLEAVRAGTPVVAGPNRAARALAAELGQAEVRASGPEALASAVRRALERSRWPVLAERARRAGEAYRWEACLPGWTALLREAAGMRS